MDPINLIITALLTGAASAAKDTASTAIKDAYASLKTLVRRRFEGKAAAQAALAESEKKPEAWKAPLEDALKETNADNDAAILESARYLLQIIQPNQTIKEYNITVHNAKGMVIGDRAIVHQTFGDKKLQE